MLADITPYTDLVQELDSLFENIDDEDEREIYILNIQEKIS